MAESLGKSAVPAAEGVGGVSADSCAQSETAAKLTAKKISAARISANERFFFAKIGF